MRLIDADALKIEIAILHGGDYKTIHYLNHAPTVDAVPVIRCKDCKHAEREDDGDIMCTFWDFCECNHHVLENGYCDRAERRNDERME